ncbi:unnamed protein product [Schistosoma rodhaini]|uniref:CHCH domain-containing protein n=1 Tax=Schistosoma rodhaini TaxID=6188 RepID=A0AA85GCF2_9TREM|nr:unnamed protein product [Schistosoma rodhaini]
MSQSNSTDHTNSYSNDSINQNTENHEQLIHSRLGSIVPECDTVKTAYDLCFQEFFPKFLKGHTYETDPCESKLKIYQNCLRDALKKSFNMDLNELDSIRTDAETIRKITSKAK